VVAPAIRSSSPSKKCTTLRVPKEAVPKEANVTTGHIASILKASVSDTRSPACSGAWLKELVGRRPLQHSRSGLFDLNDRALHHIVAFAPGPQALSTEELGEVVAEAPTATPPLERSREPSGTTSRDRESSRKEKKEKKVRWLKCANGETAVVGRPPESPKVGVKILNQALTM
jgi:hypothetical protein